MLFRSMMRLAKENLLKFNMPKPKVKKASIMNKDKLKEYIDSIKPLLGEATSEQKEKYYSTLSEIYHKLKTQPQNQTPVVYVITGNNEGVAKFKKRQDALEYLDLLKKKFPQTNYKIDVKKDPGTMYEETEVKTDYIEEK